MIEDKITLALKEIARLKDELKDIRKDLKTEEKIDNDQYLQLKTAYKELRGQIKDFEDDCGEDLKDDEHYNKLRELKIKKEEDFAHANESLFEAIAKLPQKPTQMKFETETGFINVQIQPEMRVYINGKEEKRKI